MIMDRRIVKTKQAIFQAFLLVLKEKSYEMMQVQDIIDVANVGRSTFYAHYASKEDLLEELCQELFHHMFDGRKDDVRILLAHIFRHFRVNQDRVASLLLSRNMYFLKALERELKHDVYPKVIGSYLTAKQGLPDDLLLHFVVTTFVETVSWWLQQRKKVDETTLVDYYLRLLV